ncbi:MAG: hypothetical protein WCI55_12130 [Armatimonadota bacterium]
MQHLLAQKPPRFLTILNSEVDNSGIDLVLTLGDITRHIQLKAAVSKRPHTYNVSENLFTIPGGCVVWLIHDHMKLEIQHYYFLGKSGNQAIGLSADFRAGTKKKNGEKIARSGYVGVRMSDANAKAVGIAELANLLFD